jgi:hypothetical protein
MRVPDNFFGDAVKKSLQDFSPLVLGTSRPSVGSGASATPLQNLSVTLSKLLKII